MDTNTEVMIVDNNSGNNVDFTVLDLSSFSNLKVLEVGIYYYNPNDEIVGPNRYFYLKNCERVRELKIGRVSFNDYAVCEIENVPSLEVIEMGDFHYESYNFTCASLELKSDSEGMK